MSELMTTHSLFSTTRIKNHIATELCYTNTQTTLVQIKVKLRHYQQISPTQTAGPCFYDYVTLALFNIRGKLFQIR